MITTKHASTRMSQRGLTKSSVDLVFWYGEEKGDKLILNRKNTQKIINKIKTIEKELYSFLNKGSRVISAKYDLVNILQLALKKPLVESVFGYRDKEGDKLILNRSNIKKIKNYIQTIKKEFMRIMDKGGVTIVMVDDNLVTTYNTASYKRR